MRIGENKLKLVSLLACVVALSIALSGRRPSAEKPVSTSFFKPVVRLNETLDNAESEIPELAGLDKKVGSFMRQWGLKGVTLSVMRNDSLLYAKGYGWADEEKSIGMEPSNILRLASVSKLVTAVGIMKLCEKGKLSLQDTVFGPHGILSEYDKYIKDQNYRKITVEHLLRHQGGFTARGGDPMFSTRTIMQQNHLKKAPSHEELLQCVLKLRLSFVPGTTQYYSNFGYLLLSMVIEKVSGLSYEDFIQDKVLSPAGCVDFHIARNYYKERYPREVRYYVPANEPLVPRFDNAPDSVVRCYGGNDIHALAGAGAWVASSAELARLVASIDGKKGVEDILSEESIAKMVEYFDEKTYSLGWNDTTPSKGWSRTGTFSGTSALVHYFPDGECWILITNTSTWKGPHLSSYTLALFKELRSKYSASLPKRNLFE